MMDAEMLGDIRRTLRDKEDPLPFSQQVALLDEVERLRAWERDEAAQLVKSRDGWVTTPEAREVLGRMVREAWIEWAQTQPVPKPSWLLPWESLSEPEREVDRLIGERLFREGADMHGGWALVPLAKHDAWGRREAALRAWERDARAAMAPYAVPERSGPEQVALRAVLARKP